MDIQLLITQYLDPIVLAAFTAIAGWVLTQVRAHITDKRQLTLVDQAVRAAEQFYSSSAGVQKLAYVQGIISKAFPRLDPKISRALIEAAVHGLDEGFVTVEHVATPVAPDAPATPAPDPQAIAQEAINLALEDLRKRLGLTVVPPAPTADTPPTPPSQVAG